MREEVFYDSPEGRLMFVMRPGSRVQVWLEIDGKFAFQGFVSPPTGVTPDTLYNLWQGTLPQVPSPPDSAV